jgi:hypothetical protein
MKRTDEPLDRARPLTEASEVSPQWSSQDFYWTGDSKHILFMQDSDSNGKLDLFVIDVIRSSSAVGPNAPVRNLTGDTHQSVKVYAMPERFPDRVYVGLRDRDPAWADLYMVEISTGKRVLVRRNDFQVLDWWSDRAGTPRRARRALDNGDMELARVNETGYTALYTCSIFDTCLPSKFNPEDKEIYVRSNRGSDLIRNTSLDLASGREKIVASDPEGRLDEEDEVFSRRTGALMASVFGGGNETRYV